MTAEELIHAIRSSEASSQSLKDLSARYLNVVISPPPARRGERAQIIHNLVSDGLTGGAAYAAASTKDAFAVLGAIVCMDAASKLIADPTADHAQAALEALAAAGCVGATETELIDIFNRWKEGAPEC